jgi:TPR repeat protein
MIKINFLLLTGLFYFFASISLNAGDYEKAFEALKEEKYEEASYYLSYFASNGDSVAQYNMGLLYRDGLGVEKNIEVALSWLNLAAQQKHMLANFAVAKILEKNRNLGSRDADQLNYLKEAAFSGHAIAPLEIGNYLLLASRNPTRCCTSNRLVDVKLREKCTWCFREYIKSFAIT